MYILHDGWVTCTYIPAANFRHRSRIVLVWSFSCQLTSQCLHVQDCVLLILLNLYGRNSWYPTSSRLENNDCFSMASYGCFVQTEFPVHKETDFLGIRGRSQILSLCYKILIIGWQIGMRTFHSSSSRSLVTIEYIYPIKTCMKRGPLN